MTERKDRPLILRAHRDSARAITRTLARAFIDDPAFSWIVPDRAQRPRALQRFFAIAVADDFSNGFALASPDNGAATMWREPGRAGESLLHTIVSAPAYLRAFGTCLPRAMQVGNAISAHFPAGEHYLYLHIAGVDPAQQGRGLGGAAIRAGQDAARERGLDIYLETATTDNVTIYRRLGFDVVCEFDVPGGGPHFWGMMWRHNA